MTVPDDAHIRTAPAAAGETILLVEDDDVVRRFIERALQHHGYTVHGVGDARQALEFATTCRGPIDLCLSDIVLPGMNGVAMATELRALRRETRILFMSGYTETATAGRGIVLPPGRFLQKPFSAEALATKVRDVLRTGPEYAVERG